MDHEVMVDNGIITSCSAADLPVFVAKIIEEVEEGRQANACSSLQSPGWRLPGNPAVPGALDCKDWRRAAHRRARAAMCRSRILSMSSGAESCLHVGASEGGHAIGPPTRQRRSWRYGT